ncbi:MAG: helix-turn-helix transcriptional regulator [Phyllobacteriaceae bacterium]|nr:helix-turn-helix transcriptional regulator [Phyllobacteriaceae bacterium]
MSTQFALDLRLARRKAGLTQRDTAHLLALDPSKLSKLERGRRLPTLTEIVTLSLIFGRSFEALFSSIIADAREALRRRLPSVPTLARVTVATTNRDATLARLEAQLAAERDDHGA